ncbi:XdhC family protein [Stenotrophomonas maltophilia]|uniref:XdhC family protein n=1 Tax=Stenotrophomonas maltophilia TaxID=40324 RepID=UPI000D7E3369|nr:XdhC family protein [Stenotrophomonas maltophilia]AWT14871.1 hypothetical protein DM611_11640 [Stenotrophomonas maltophilia]
MAVREDGLYCGFVSGGCVERAVAFEALDVIALGGDRQMRYGQGSPYIDIVLPCGGGITLSLHRLRCAQPLWAVLRRHRLNPEDLAAYDLLGAVVPHGLALCPLLAGEQPISPKRATGAVHRHDHGGVRVHGVAQALPAEPQADPRRRQGSLAYRGR